MSTDLHILCVNHGERSDEVGNAYRDISRVREYIAQRVELHRVWLLAKRTFPDLEFTDISWNPAELTGLRFVIAHAQCHLELQDEYGRYYDLTADPEKCYGSIILPEGGEYVVLECQRDQADRHQSHIHEGVDFHDVKFKVTWNQPRSDRRKEQSHE